MKKITSEFYNRDTLDVAKDLLGKRLVRVIDTDVLVTKITEVEAYKANIDKACHAYGNKYTERTKTMYGKPGIAYVYLIYGMYYCFNVVTEAENIPSAVLIRGVEPIKNIDIMSKLRYKKEYNQLNNYQKKNFSNGPGKLCMALNIDKQFNGYNLTNNQLYICENKEQTQLDIKVGKRINIDYAEEAKDFMWRFYL